MNDFSKALLINSCHIFIYKDKNLSPIFCIWDRMFGTYQEELDEEPCVFGVTQQVNTWNPGENKNQIIID